MVSPEVLEVHRTVKKVDFRQEFFRKQREVKCQCWQQGCSCLDWCKITQYQSGELVMVKEISEEDKDKPKRPSSIQTH